MRLAGLCALLTTLLACGADALGPPRVQPAPAVDDRPALRGGGGPRSPRLASYQLDATLDDAAHRITATEVLRWTNAGASPVTTLPLHLYLNAFANDTTLFMTSSGGQLRDAHAAADGWGWIDVTSIREVGADRPELRPSARFVGPDETVLEVPLPHPVAPGEHVELALAFTAQLPEVFARTGHRGAFTMVGQWFPKVGVRVGAPGAETWSTLPFHGFAEFFADFGVYDVKLTVPSTLVVAATGVRTAVTDNPDGSRTHVFHAEDVHDFAWMTDPYMQTLEATATVDGQPVLVRVLFRPAQRAFAARHLAAGVGAIEQFSRLFGAYPWSTMTIIDPPLDAADGAGGMEYPTLVTTGGDTALARPGMRLPEYVTVHEIGHNWFQGLLASDERLEPWLDEGVNEWADGAVMAALYGERTSALDWRGWQADIYRLRRAFADDPGALPVPIATPAAGFPDAGSYAAASYDGTLQVLRSLELTIGRDAFADGMRRYASTWAFRHPTGDDLIAALAAAAPDANVAGLLGPALRQRGGLDLAIDAAGCAPTHPPRGRFVDRTSGAVREVDAAAAPDAGAWRCDVLIGNRGVVPAPVDVETRYADGSSRRDRWTPSPGQPWFHLRVERSSPLVEVAIDPDGALPMQRDPLALRRRLEDDDAAATRAAARIASWGQALLPEVGL